MATVSTIRLQNLRSHEDITVKLSDGVTVITGANGSGKTTIVEALYLTHQGTSFKGSDSELLKTAKPWWRVDILFSDGHKRTAQYEPERPAVKKKFIVDEKTNYRLLPKFKLPVVLFDPDDLRLLHGSPSRRRQFIDRFISQLNPLYATTIRKYERVLRQRNILLKKPQTTQDDLFPWNIALSEHGAYIIEQRIMFIEQINQKLNDAYKDIAKTDDIVSVHYSHTLVGDGKQKLLNELYTQLARDRALGSTSVGPHRHDVVFEFNNSPALSVASRGEARTVILALKFLEVDIIEQLTGIKPIILLDDVFSELDITRQHSLSNTIRSHQIVITSTHVIPGEENFTHISMDQ